MDIPSCGCPQSTAGVMHTFECQMSSQRVPPAFVGREPTSDASKPLTQPVTFIYSEPLDAGIDSFKKGVIANLAMQELRLMCMRGSHDGYVMEWPPGTTDIGRALKVVLDRFQTDYTNGLIAELAQRIYTEVYR